MKSALCPGHGAPCFRSRKDGLLPLALPAGMMPRHSPAARPGTTLFREHTLFPCPSPPEPSDSTTAEPRTFRNTQERSFRPSPPPDKRLPDAAICTASIFCRFTACRHPSAIFLPSSHSSPFCLSADCVTIGLPLRFHFPHRTKMPCRSKRLSKESYEPI